MEQGTYDRIATRLSDATTALAEVFDLASAHGLAFADDAMDARYAVSELTDRVEAMADALALKP